MGIICWNTERMEQAGFLYKISETIFSSIIPNIFILSLNPKIVHTKRPLWWLNLISSILTDFVL
jgi:hypothetical protein